MSASYQEYAEISVTTDVMNATSHRLIQLLFEKCLLQMQLAKIHIQEGDVIKKCHAITKAMDIIGYLRMCLNQENKDTMELSKSLDLLYYFIERKLLDANIQNNADCLEQAKTVLASIKSGWDGIGG